MSNISQSQLKVWQNEVFVPADKASVSVFDHGLLYGDGVFEGIRFYNKKVFQLKAHIQRLFESAKAICLDIPYSNETLENAVAETMHINNLTDGYVRLIVTRGNGALGLNPFACENPQVIIIAANIALYPQECYEQGLKIITCATRRSSIATLSPQIKSLNYLPNILAKIECIQAGVMEGIMLNAEGYVSECTGDNIFIIKNQIVSTPHRSSGILEGITRNIVVDLLKKRHIEVREELLTQYDLYTADEIFLTGTAAKVVPCVEIDKRQIGSGTPGNITQTVMQDFLEYAYNYEE